MARAITVKLIGGPLDGTTRREWVPEHWDALRFDHRRNGSLHVYWGEIAGDQAVLDHISYERIGELEQ